MSMYKCGKCGQSHCDPELYNAVSNIGKSKSMLIKCYGCERITRIIDMEDKPDTMESITVFIPKQEKEE